MIKICIIMQAIQTLGGVQRVVSAMMNSLANDPNYEIYIYTPFVERDEELFPVNEKIVLVNSKEFQPSGNFFTRVIKKLNRNTKILMPFPHFVENVYFTKHEVTKLCNYVRNRGISIVIGASPMHAILAGIVSSKLNEVKAIAWMHSPYESYFFRKDNPTYSMQKLFEKYSRYYEKVFVLTEADKSIYSRYLTNIKERITVFHNPVTIEAKDKSSLESNRILYVGRINTQHKGCDLLFKIAKLMKDKGKEFVLDIVGEGDYLDTFKGLVEENGLQNNVIFHGISNDVEKYYKCASVQLVTSRYEGFGLIITEAMSFGIPVIAFHAQGPDEIITDKVSGYLIPQFDCEQYANRVMNLLDDRVLLLSMSQNAFERSKSFSLKVAVGKFKNHVEECIYQ